MQCAVCNHALDPIEYEGTLIHTCDGCGGEFVGADALAHIVRTREERFDHGTVAGCAPTHGMPDGATERGLPCPACGEAMGLVNYAGDTGVCVDRCGRCGGVWLDRDELEQVQRLSEAWADRAPGQMQAIAGDLDAARRAARDATSNAFQDSRFAFVNAVMNRLLDVA